MIELRALGSPELRGEGDALCHSFLSGPKRLALLAYLVVERPEGFHRRDSLLPLFWPEQDQPRARTALRGMLYQIRQALGSEVIQSRGREEIAVRPGTLWCDAIAFEEALAVGRVREALDLYRGPLLEGLHVPDVSPEFEHWLDARRERLQRRAIEATWALAEEVEKSGQRDAARAWATRAVGLAPLSEDAHRRLIALLDRIGDRAGAIQAYEHFSGCLHAEWEAEPAPETQALIRRIREREEMIAGEEYPQPTPHSLPRTDGDKPAIVHSPAPPTGPALRPRWSLRKGWPMAGTLAAFLIALLAADRMRDAPRLAPDRVVVAPFENRTGNPALDPVGLMAADWITQGLGHSGLAKVVPVTAALASAGHVTEATTSGTVVPARLGAEAGAALVVTGRVYQQGDSLYVQAQITDVRKGEPLLVLAPVTAPRDAPMGAIAAMRQQVLAGLASRLDPRLETYAHSASQPPTYAAYQHYVVGMEHFVRRDYQAATRHLERANALDSTYTLPLIYAAGAYMNLRQWARTDSLTRRVQRFTRPLAPYDRALLGSLRAWVEGDTRAAYEASKRNDQLAPNSLGHYVLGMEALRLGRAEEATRVLEAIDPTRGEMRGWLPYWAVLTDAYHLQGDHGEEYQAARRGRRLHPDDPRSLFHEARALVARGRWKTAEELIAARLLLPHERYPDPGQWVLWLGDELRVHGDPTAAQRVYERALAWYQTRPPSTQEIEEHQRGRALALLRTGQWREAEALYRALAQEYPERIEYTGHLGVLAARQNRLAQAERIAHQLSTLQRPYLHGQDTYWGARIAAQLGQADRAVVLLREAFSEGLPVSIDLHTEPDLDPLRKHPGFRELAGPRG